VRSGRIEFYFNEDVRAVFENYHLTEGRKGRIEFYQIEGLRATSSCSHTKIPNDDSKSGLGCNLFRAYAGAQ
ncbi:hypothetical protein HAX54_011607, partial [Datura stramonium]|nr:hypothetical protein [Datura stramonium]